MASTAKAQSSIQRINHAYVQVPASPLSLATYRPLKTSVHATSTKLKENTPLRPLQFTNKPSASRKRELPDFDSMHDGSIPLLKKAKLAAAVGTPSKVQAPRSQPIIPTANACPSFPNGYVYCHQCAQKRDILTTVQCNAVKHRQTKSKGIVEWPCINKYCKRCLKRRYNEDLEACTNDVASSFRCPRCRGICSCPRCKKLLGVDAIGPLGSHSTVPGIPKTAKSEKKPRVQTSKATDVVKPTKKVLPQLKWTPVPHILTQAQAEERILIREFALRFGHTMEPIIAKSSLEELQFIAGKTENNGDGEIPPWVSEACIKGLVLGILGLLAKDHETEIAKEIKTAIKTIRSAGVNLNKMWSNLVVLRDNLATPLTPDAQPLVWVPFTFPDPSPAPLSCMPNMRGLRSVRSIDASGNFVNVVHTAQMIPVLISLIHSVLETANVREEIDQGIKDARDIARDAKEAIKIENERWDKERKDMEPISEQKVDKNEDKAKGKAHKERISNIHNIMKLTTHGFTPRFSTLGMDHEGRTYYALSPGVLEREVAFEYLEVVSADKPRKLKKKGRILAAEERSEMKEWSWFVSVWGKKPLSEGGSMKPQHVKNDTDGLDEEDVEDVETWWGFWEPEEIVKVADWIFIKSKLEDEEIPEDGISSQTKKDPTKMQLKRLVTQLKDFAALLEWRARENKFSIIDAPALEQII